MKYAIFLLGNPGPEYKLTRHNAARILFNLNAPGESDEIDLGLLSLKDDNSAEIAKAFRATLVVPDTYMNLTGTFIKKYLKYHENIIPIIAYDDKDIELGKFKIGKFKSSGGHNGVQSIIEELGSKDFLRVRIGIAPKALMPIHGEVVQGFVMGKFTEEEVEVIKSIKTDVLASIVKAIG